MKKQNTTGKDAVQKDVWNPSQYQQFQKERNAPGFDLIDLIEDRPEGYKRAIDLGCGTGELTKALMERKNIQDVVGADNSDAMLGKAKAYGGQGLRFEPGDLSKFEAKDSYDIIYSNAAFQWVDDHEGLFRRCHHSLKRGGQLAVQMPMNHDYPTHVIAAALAREEPYRSALGLGEESPSHLLSMEGYATLLHRLGFREQKVYTRVYAHILENREGVVEWVKGTMLTTYEKGLSPKLFEHFLTEYRKRLFQSLPDERPFFYPFKRLLLWAKL